MDEDASNSSDGNGGEDGGGFFMSIGEVRVKEITLISTTMPSENL